MYRLSIFLVIFLTTPFSYSADYEYPDIEKSVFKIRTPQSLGTTFYIGNNLFVTNAHAVFAPSQIQKYKLINEMQFNKIIEQNSNLKKEISKRIRIYFRRNSRPVESIVALDFVNDLAVLRVREPDMLLKDKTKKLSKLIPLEIGYATQDLKNKKGYIYGFPDHRPYFKTKKIHLREMTFKNISSIQSESLEVYVNENHLKGASGSPVLVDGQVVGVLKKSVYNSASAIPSNALKNTS